jgi:predicted PurR-regulated permease PerM
MKAKREYHDVLERLEHVDVKQLSGTLRKNLKWIALAGVGIVLMGILLIGVLIIGLINLIIRPILSQGPALQDQSQGIIEVGQQWIGQQFGQEQQQLQEIQGQLNQLQQVVEGVTAPAEGAEGGEGGDATEPAGESAEQ